MDKDTRNAVVGVFVFSGLVIGLIWMFTSADLNLTSYFAPKYEQVRRNTFVQSEAFNVGQVQELDQMEREYKRSNDPSVKASIASEFNHRVSGYNLNDPAVSDDLRAFAASIR